MITSIRFTGEDKNDYLLSRRTKNVLRKGKTQESYEKALQNRKFGQRESDIFDEYYKVVDDGLANDRANKCLIGRDIHFERDRINIIFGPNASGKTTILKTIAAYCLCGTSHQFDGFTSIDKFQPIDYPYSFDKESKYTHDILNDMIIKRAGNHAIIDWDGSPVYFQNFANRSMYSIDDYYDTILGDCMEAMLFSMNKSKSSDGKQTIYLFSKLYNLLKMKYSFDNITELFENKTTHVNDTWIKCYKNNYSYIEKFQNNNKDHITLLLDEIDKSLDINNIGWMFTELLPQLHDVNHDQIIVISHSPLVCSPDICSPEKYNFISMDEEYTNSVKKLFGKINF